MVGWGYDGWNGYGGLEDVFFLFLTLNSEQFQR